jgi:nitric oxide reductase large subunit
MMLIKLLRLAFDFSRRNQMAVNHPNEHGVAHARSLEFYNTTLLWQWLRLPGDVVFAIGALLMAYDFIVKLRPFFPKLAHTDVTIAETS